MSRWEWIARSLLVLASYGYDMQFFDKYLDDPEFLTLKWLYSHYGEEVPEYVKTELQQVSAYDEHQSCDHHWIDEPQIVCAHCGAFQ